MSVGKTIYPAREGIIYYPNGTLLWSHKCEQPKPALGMISDMGEDWSLKETVRPPKSTLCFWFSDTVGIDLGLSNDVPYFSLPILPATSFKTMYGLMGDDGEEFNEITDGIEVDEAGARTVMVRSSDVKFDAWSVKTWNLNHFRWLWIRQHEKLVRIGVNIIIIIYFFILWVVVLLETWCFKPEREGEKQFHWV